MSYRKLIFYYYIKKEWPVEKLDQFRSKKQIEKSVSMAKYKRKTDKKSYSFMDFMSYIIIDIL